MQRRQLIGPGVVAVVVLAGVVLAATAPTGTDAPTGPSQGSGSGGSSGATDPTGPTLPATPRPIPKHEVYGFVPYWEMDGSIAAHLATTELTTLALFSVTNDRDGGLDMTQNGYKRITGDIGARLIDEAHDRGTRVELVFTSFGFGRNARLFGTPELQAATIASLVRLTADLGMDGINVDVESLELDDVAAFGGFVGDLRAALRAENGDAQVSVATTGGRTGAAMAVVASAAGADRIFLMGYDYRTAGSDPGASAPIDRRDGAERDLVWSLDLYESLGVPVERTLLGLPLYGVTWPVAGPALGDARTGQGDTWFPNEHLDFLAAPPVASETDEIEQVEFYAIPPANGATPDPVDGAPAPGWRAIYVDSPATLTPKLALADSRGLAGAGFWAIGYERGLPDYTNLIARFRAGQIE